MPRSIKNAGKGRRERARALGPLLLKGPEKLEGSGVFQSHIGTRDYASLIPEHRVEIYKEFSQNLFGDSLLKQEFALRNVPYRSAGHELLVDFLFSSLLSDSGGSRRGRSRINTSRPSGF